MLSVACRYAHGGGRGRAPLPAAVGERLHGLTSLRYQEDYGLTETISQTPVNPPDRPKLQCLGVPPSTWTPAS